MSHRSDSTWEDLVNDLVAEWVERRQCGDDVPLGVLCSHDPRLIATVSAQIERLKQTDWLFDEPEPKVVGGAGDTAGEELLGRDRWSHRVLGEYQILERIGEGGMGRVYKALHRSMKRIVALKVIHPRVFRSPDAVARFRREIAAAARLNHPHVVVSHDAGESGGWNYLVMEYVDGIDLASLVQRDGPLPVDRAVSYVLQAARALAYTHREGIVHRDVKPSNLMLDDSGTLKLLDLGLARIADVVAQEQPDSAHTLTGSGQVMGTVDYLAPEQARDSRRADECSDIYALGCTLYALVHGRPMYDGRSMVGRLLAHQDAPAPALGADRSDVSARLEAVFQRMVAKRPRDRFQSMGELVSALSEADARFGPAPVRHVETSPSPLGMGRVDAGDGRPRERCIFEQLGNVLQQGRGTSARSVDAAESTPPNAGTGTARGGSRPV
jgi:serine/threonine protein kinase